MGVVIPKVGDQWEVRLPRKRKVVKEVGRIYMAWMRRADGSSVHRPYIAWDRLPKGRHTGIRVRHLLMYGKRLSTKKERDAKFQARFGLRARRDAADSTQSHAEEG